MTIAPHWLDELYTPSALVEKPRTLDKYAVEALGTFGLVLTMAWVSAVAAPMRHWASVRF